MKIRDRLAWFLTASAAGILLIVILIVYFTSAAHRKQYFLNELKEDVKAKEEGLEGRIKSFSGLENSPQEPTETGGLDGKKVIILPLERKKRAEDSLKTLFPAEFVDELLHAGYAEFQLEEQEGVGQLFRQGNADFVIVVGAHDRLGRAQLKSLIILLVVSFLLCLPVLYLLGRLLARHVLKPIADKVRKARRISASNMHLRLNVYNEKDEMGQLAITFNDMLDRLETSFEMQKNFISNASHEIRNPLTAIIGEAEVALERRRKPEEYIESLRNISIEADRLDVLVSNLLNLAKVDLSETDVVEIRMDEILFDVKLTALKTYPKCQINIDFSGVPENPNLLMIKGNANLLSVAFTNLVENACKFSDNQEVVVKLFAPESAVQLQIVDKGVGIPPEEIQNIFQPFYRARNARVFKGFGIGLSLTDKIIKLHKGQIDIFSEEGKGTTITLTFPRCANVKQSK